MAHTFFGKKQVAVGMEQLSQRAETVEQALGKAAPVRRVAAAAEQQRKEFGITRLAITWLCSLAHRRSLSPAPGNNPIVPSRHVDTSNQSRSEGPFLWKWRRMKG
jgi:hypothetical protein